MHSRFRGIIFDMDGTLTEPIIDFGAIRRELGILAGDLLHEIDRLPDATRDKAWLVVERHEEEALQKVQLQNGVPELLGAMREAGVKLGLLTRNLQRSVDFICSLHGLTFDTVVTRAFRPAKPDPAPVLHILAQWQLPAADVLVVGDYIHDIECGRAAGTKTCFFQNPGMPDYGTEADFTVRSMAELADLLIWEPGEAC